MKNTVPIISALRDQALEERHWEEINAILNTDADIHSDTFTLQSLIDLNLDQPARDQISEIALKASKEAELEQLFNKVQADWRFVKFDVNPYKDTKDYYVISSTEEVNEILEESLVALNTILTSRYADHIRQEVEEFNTKKLSYLELLIDEWME